jgi:pilus assembly protein CpaE
VPEPVRVRPFERAGVVLVSVGVDDALPARVADALGIDARSVPAARTATAAEEWLGEQGGRSAVFVVGPTLKDDDALGLVEFVGRSSPGSAVVLVRDQIDRTALTAALRAGMREVVQSDAPPMELAGAIDRALRWSSEVRRALGRRRPTVELSGAFGRVVSVFSSKGGTGKTFLAANLSTALADVTQQDTAVIELDLGRGDLLSFFGQEATGGVDALVRLAEEADVERLKGAATKAGEHLWVYGATPVRGHAVPPSAETVGKLVTALQRAFAYTVIDAPPAYTDPLLQALELSDLVCLVAMLDVVGVRHLSVALSTLRSLGLPMDRFLVVLNRADSKVRLTPQSIESVMRLKVDARIPSSRLVPASLNRGQPAYLAEPKSELVKSIRKLAELIVSKVPASSASS